MEIYLLVYSGWPVKYAGSLVDCDISVFPSLRGKKKWEGAKAKDKMLECLAPRRRQTT